MAKELTPETLQRIEQLEQSKIIIDNKIDRLTQMRQLTQTEINKLGGMTTYALAGQQAAAAAAGVDTPFIYTDGEVLHLDVWLTLDHYADQHKVAPELLGVWIRSGKIPADDIRVVSPLDDLRLIRDKVYNSTT